MDRSRHAFRTLLWAAACLLPAATSAADAPDGPIEPLCVLSVNADPVRILVAWNNRPDPTPETRMIVGTAPDSLAWAVADEARQDAALSLKPVEPTQWSASTAGVRAWLVPPDLIARLRNGWPAEAPLRATIESVGPGQHSVWIETGTQQGAAAGDTWLLCAGGQPLARFDVRYVSTDLSFAVVVPLVADLHLRPGLHVELWPGPGERRTQRATSAVSYVETEPAGPIVWVALPPDAGWPAEPHLDIFQEGRFIGHALAERSDSRFGYATYTPLAPAPAPVAATSQPTTAATQPAPAGNDGLPRVGDHVRIRTQADIDQRRFVAHVFELVSGGALINAGENAALELDQHGTVYRDNVAVGEVHVVRLQRSYALVQPPRPEQTTGRPNEPPPLQLQVGDEVRFAPPPPPSPTVATIERIGEQRLFMARCLQTPAPLGVPLAVRENGRTIGAAVLFVTDESTAGGLLLDRSLRAVPSAGAELVLTP